MNTVKSQRFYTNIGENGEILNAPREIRGRKIAETLEQNDGMYVVFVTLLGALDGERPDQAFYDRFPVETLEEAADFLRECGTEPPLAHPRPAFEIAAQIIELEIMRRSKHQ